MIAMALGCGAPFSQAVSSEASARDAWGWGERWFWCCMVIPLLMVFSDSKA
jgi:hypothetical protein